MFTLLRKNTNTLAKPLLKGLASVFMSGLCLGSPLLAVAQESSYILGPSDVIAISVYEEEDLSFEEIRIGDSGRINYPFLGEINAIGNSVSGLESLIRKGLMEGEFLIDPTVSVHIVQYRSFYIDGEVEEPDSYPFEPGLTLRKAVSIAGGFTERASRSKITILAEGADADDDAAQVESLDVPVRPGDIITVEGRLF